MIRENSARWRTSPKLVTIDIDRISALAKVNALRRIPSRRAPREWRVLGLSELFVQPITFQPGFVCTRVAVVVTLLFVPAGRKNHAWFDAYVSSLATVLA
jgi:hypothetical protein